MMKERPLYFETAELKIFLIALRRLTGVRSPKTYKLISQAKDKLLQEIVERNKHDEELAELIAYAEGNHLKFSSHIVPLSYFGSHLPNDLYAVITKEHPPHAIAI